MNLLYKAVKWIFGVCGFEIHRKTVRLKGLRLLMAHTGLDLKVNMIPLKSSSVYVDIGAFEGVCAEAINDEYGCKCYLFEPAPRAFGVLAEKFVGKDNVQINNCAVLDRNETGILYFKHNPDGHSLFKTTAQVKDHTTSFSLKVCIVDIVDFLQTNFISSVDLLKLNCEGGEWSILRRLIATNYISHIQHIIIGWHWSACESKSTGQAIQEHLAITHEMIESNPGWELWRLRE